MPYKDPARQIAFQIAWMKKRRDEWFAGKVCARCGSTENLVLDHRDPKLKVSHRIWSWCRERREAELAKCQALCRYCHRLKTAAEAARGERARCAKLTTEDVRLIRSSRLPGVVLADLLGVGKSTISSVRNRRTWKHVA